MDAERDEKELSVRNHLIKGIFLTVATAVMWTMPSAQGPSFQQSISNQEMLAHGKSIYQKRCMGCHGIKGDGQGKAARFLDPKPRDFVSGIFKFKSTPNEALPTDTDLMRVLSQGVLGTSMPAFPLLPEVSKYAVIQYIKTFSPAWREPENRMAKIQGAPFPRDDFKAHKKFLPRAKKGRALFLDNCVVCHGRTGKGDGEGSEGLVDDWDNPIQPGNLTRPHIKAGRSVRDIYRVLLTGMAGTPMPSFKEALSDGELWDVSAYILYLRGLEAGVYGSSPPLKEISKTEAEE